MRIGPQKILATSLVLLLFCGRTQAADDEKDDTSSSGSNLRKTPPASLLQDDHRDEFLPEPKIINGENARRGRFEYMVRLTGPYLCGGALIARDLVLTAAHCEQVFTRAQIGRWDWTDPSDEDPELDKTIAEYYAHPGWEAKGKVIPNDDLMVLKLDSPVPEGTPTIRLNFDNNIPANTGDPITQMGFGSTVDFVPGPLELPATMQEMQTDYLAFEDCAVAYDLDNPSDRLGVVQPNGQLTTMVQPDWLCTLPPVDEPRVANCKGDSGSPVIIEGATMEDDILVGIVSGGWGGGCQNKYMPDFQQRVSYQVDWILSVACPATEYPPAEWNCPGFEGPPTPLLGSDTPAPTPPPVPSPTRPPNPSPTPGPAPSPIAAPVPEPTTITIEPTPTPRTFPPFPGGTFMGPSNQAPVTPAPTPVPPPPTRRPRPTNAPDTPSPTMAPVPRTFPPFEGGFNLGPTRPPVPTAPTAPVARPTGGGGGGGGGRPSRPTGPSFEIDAYITIIFDNHPEEIGWTLRVENSKTYQVQVPFHAYPIGRRIIVDRVSLDAGQTYEFEIRNAAANGLSDGPVAGSYSIVLRDCEGRPTIVSGGSDWGSSEVTIFTMPTEC